MQVLNELKAFPLKCFWNTSLPAGEKEKSNPTKTKTQEQWLVATCCFFRSIVLMETADCTVKVERRGSKQEMLLGLFFNGRTHSINSQRSKAVQHLRKKSSHVDTTYLEDICFQIRHLSCLPHTKELSPTTPHWTRQPHLQRAIGSWALPRVWAYLKPLSWSVQKRCPTPTWCLLKIYSIADYWDTLH